MSEPRGLRLNNPACIRRNSIVWDGQADVQADPDFVTFIAPVWGLRALVKILDAYQRDGVKTIREAIAGVERPPGKRIGGYSPASDGNPTDTYVANVAAACHVDPDAPVVLSVYRVPMVRAICRQESEWDCPDSLLAEAIDLAEAA